ncbi:MAG: hypothetical protein WA152_02570 [Microgenomates group bacterium]
MDIITTIILTISGGLIGGYITYYFSEKTENYKFEVLRREQSAKVAMLLAKWIKYRGKENKFLNEKEQIDHYEELNKMSLELSLWIKDHILLNKIHDLFQIKPNAMDVRSVTAEVRKYIHNLKNDDLNPKEITLWPNAEETVKLFKL